MLIAMEGSSPTIAGENNRKYYVWNAYNETVQSPKVYIPGPATISMTGSPINIRKMADDATKLIRVAEGPIFLIGWSRGAAACIQVALDLKRAGFSRNVDAMFLFDPVDQDGSTSDFLNLIPNNVSNCYRARATNKTGIWARIFPTCGNYYEEGVNDETRDFGTSHGGIAGTEGGMSGDAGSHEWIWSKLSYHGVI